MTRRWRPCAAGTGPGPATPRRAPLARALLAATVLALPSAATRSQPAEGALGRWTPLSRALEPLGPLLLSADRIEWSICRGARLERIPGDARLLYAIRGDPGCAIDGRGITHLLIVPRGGCNAELMLYTGSAQLQTNDPQAWGVVERAGCG